MIPDKMVEAARDGFGRSFYDGTNNIPDDMIAWRDALEAAGMGELVRALKPFAEIAKQLVPELHDDVKNNSYLAVPRVGDLRRALAVLEKLRVEVKP